LKLAGIIIGLVVIVGAIFASKVLYPEAPPSNTEKKVSKPKYSGKKISPIPEVEGLDEGIVSLGEKLFNDTILSADKTVSCASCHILMAGGDNNLATSIGVGGALVKINSPTVFNSSLNFKQFWDGRADDLEEQVSGPINNPKEMGSNWEEVVSRLKASIEYSSLFIKYFPDGINKKNISLAIAEFERSLLTPNSPFDKFLKGDAAALTQEEKDGYKLFDELGCVRCHQGVGIGGNMFQRMGAKRNYFNSDDEIALGRYNITKKEVDKYRFKVPSLRNVAITAPYFHDGSAQTLEDAVNVMAKFQLARRLKPDELKKIVAFLKTLTGEYKGKSLARGAE
jgi:cytochrome c peroxidase